MGILHFSKSDYEPGATRAAYEVHRLFVDEGVDSVLFTMKKETTDPSVIALPKFKKNNFKSIWNRIILKYSKKSLAVRNRTIKYGFNADYATNVDFSKVFLINPEDIDLLVLHFITDFLSFSMIKKLYNHFKCPVVWVVMDMEPITGGCHQSFGCENYQKNCGNCPYFGSDNANDLSRTIMKRKRKYLTSIPIYFSCPNSWIKDWVNKSSLFFQSPAMVIPLPLDTSIFHYMDMNNARSVLGVPTDKKVIFIGARFLEDLAKGMKHLKQALSLLQARIEREQSGCIDDYLLLIVGRNPDKLLANIQLHSKYLGIINSEKLALAYQASDVFACPSLYDAGPLMISEAMLCGTSVVAFKTGTAVDLVKNNISGRIVEFGNVSEYADALFSTVNERNSMEKRNLIIEMAQIHSYKAVSAKYNELLRELRLI